MLARQKYLQLQCPPLISFTLGRHKSDNNNQMIQLIDVFCVLYITGQAIFDYYEPLIQLTVIPLSGGQ
jgi:hypothetical protein